MNEEIKKSIRPSSASERARPPVVVVMGHVDHGKTTLLDKIRETNILGKDPSSSQHDRFRSVTDDEAAETPPDHFRSVVEGEAGGITQHIGAYEIVHNGKRLTFLDTPGHEAFSKMRARGAKVADVAILVVAADEGVKPQTKEAISHILESKTPMVVALNKIDRPGANPDRVKQELASENVLVEGRGGNVPSIEISAKKGQGIDELLELILLIAEMEDLVADPAAKAEGVVIESQLEKKRGLASTLLVKNGTLKNSDSVLAGSAFAKIKLLENFKGEPISEAGPGVPARVLGWESLPQVGDTFQSGKEKELRALALEMQKLTTLKEKETGDLILVIKADVTGSLEALEGAIQALPKEDLRVVIIASDVGEITESDIKLAYATSALIIGFRAKISREGEVLIKQYPCKILQSDIIYELLHMLQQEIKNITANKKTASLRSQLEVLAIFGEKGSRQVIGGRVSEKPLEKRMTMKILRKNTEIGKVKILNLQQEKRDTSKVDAGNECGAFIDSPITVVTGDILIEVKNEKD